MKAPSHIVILCSRLDSPGGIERAVVNTANLFVQQNLPVTLLVLDDVDGCFYPVNEAAKVERLSLTLGIQQEGNTFTKKFRLLNDVRLLRNKLTELQPTLVIATEHPFAVAAVMSGIKRSAKVISWEHRHYGAVERSAFWQSLFSWAYRKLDAIICLNKDEAALFAKHNKNIVIIPNFCTPQAFSPTVEQKKRLLTIGHLSHTKGIDRLLSIAKTVLQNHPNWQWKLIGEGELAEEVVAFIQSHNLNGQLILQAPTSPHIRDEYKQASLYVTTSRNECFPMTLLEAMQQGLPCVAFDCDTGPRAIIQNNVTGILVEDGDEKAMVEALEKLMVDASLRSVLSHAAFQSIEAFSAGKIWSKWEAFFTAL